MLTRKNALVVAVALGLSVGIVQIVIATTCLTPGDDNSSSDNGEIDIMKCSRNQASGRSEFWR